MEHGFKTTIMVLYGFRTIIMIFILMEPEDIGCLLHMAGHGCLITAGVGLLFIMADGFMIRFMAGFGYPDINGDLPG